MILLGGGLMQGINWWRDKDVWDEIELGILGDFKHEHLGLK